MATVRVWTERGEPNTPNGVWRDCTYAAGLMGLVFGGFTKFPLGIYTIAEREALERSDSQPDETGASAADLIEAVLHRYGIKWTTVTKEWMVERRDRPDLGFIIGGSNGNLPAGHNLRRWDPGFTGGHRVFVVPQSNGLHAVWYDPEAPNQYGGDITDWPTISRWMGTVDPDVIAVRADAYAPPAPPVEPPVYTEAQMQAVKDQLDASQRALDIANARIAAARAALG